MEHWLPLFFDKLETIFDYAAGAPILLESLADDAVAQRQEQIIDYFEARCQALGTAGSGLPYRPLPPDRLYVLGEEWRERLGANPRVRLTPFSVLADKDPVIDIGARQGRSFVAEREQTHANLFDAVVTHVNRLQADGKRVMFAVFSQGSLERIKHVLSDHGLMNLAEIGNWPEAISRPKLETGLAVLGLEAGFELADVAIISEQDVLGDRWVRPRRAGKRAADFIAEVTSLAPADLVVHVDHGIGRFAGLTTIEAAGAPHDCLAIQYAGGDKLFLPVENVELLSRYGSDQAGVELDRLGGGAWQARKARLKQRIREIAGEAYQSCGRAAVSASAAFAGGARALRRVLRRISVRGNRRSAYGYRSGARGPRFGASDGPAYLWGRGLR